jgi:hypothetical protein
LAKLFVVLLIRFFPWVKWSKIFVVLIFPFVKMVISGQIFICHINFSPSWTYGPVCQGRKSFDVRNTWACSSGKGGEAKVGCTVWLLFSSPASERVTIHFPFLVATLFFSSYKHFLSNRRPNMAQIWGTCRCSSLSPCPAFLPISFFDIAPPWFLGLLFSPGQYWHFIVFRQWCLAGCLAPKCGWI